MVMDHMDQWGPIFPSEVGWHAEQNSNINNNNNNNNNNCNNMTMTMMMEKRQLFLRSYQFSRKRSVADKIKRGLVRVKKVIWFRLRSARRFRKLVWSRLRFAFSNRRRGRFLRLLNNTADHHHHLSTASSSCFW